MPQGRITTAAVPSEFTIPRDNKAARTFATVAIVVGCLFVGLTLPKALTEIAVYRYCALWFGPFLAASFVIQAGTDLKRLIRTDVVALASLYFLTFAEFLDPNVMVLYTAVTGHAEQACDLVLTTFAMIAIGRHFPLPFRRTRFSLPQIPGSHLHWIALACFFLGFLWPLITVNFNPLELFYQAVRPRFTQPWTRGREGGWLSFLTELDLLLFVAAALIGVIVGNGRRYAWHSRLLLIVLFVLMLAFDALEGSRYVVVVKFGLFIAGYMIARRKAGNIRLISLSLLSLALIWFASGEMLRMRTIGFESYMSGSDAAQAYSENGFMIDNNMVTLARTVSVYPQLYAFPGSDIIVSSLTKWVPRALWPSKPVDWGTSLEQALATGGGYTLAVTFTGEAYLIGGMTSLVLASLLFGSLFATWDKFGQNCRSNLDLTLYVSGFFAAALGMRSLQFVTVALVPTVAIFLFGRFVARKQRAATSVHRRWA